MKYTIEIDDAQLRVVMNALEDVGKFLSGKTGLRNTIAPLDNYQAVADQLRSLRHLVTPEHNFADDYDRFGTGCRNDQQRKLIARTLYMAAVMRNALGSDYKKSPVETNRDTGAEITITKKEND
jgi:hypothetical protein